MNTQHRDEGARRQARALVREKIEGIRQRAAAVAGQRQAISGAPAPAAAPQSPRLRPRQSEPGTGWARAFGRLRAAFGGKVPR